MRRFLRWTGVTLGLLAVIALAAGFWLRAQIRASLPILDGTVELAGLSAAVTVVFDDQGIPMIRAADRHDVARATGFLHAQNRYFQMDLFRRRAAGELAALFGAAALDADREVRIHGFRALAGRILRESPRGPRELIRAYTEGVNAGLASLKSSPFEYLLLRAEPDPWLPEDTILVILNMHLELIDSSGTRESTLGVMRDVLPGPVFDFLAQPGTEWDAPLTGEVYPEVPIPGPEVIGREDLRSASRLPGIEEAAAAELAPGSNSWAVGGALTTHGGAILANDMHLGLGVPNIWYRLTFEQPAPGGGTRRVTGVTLPGTPAMIVGSNGEIAWGFTNSQGDWLDLVVVETDPEDPDVYMTPDGPRRLERREEIIRVKGGEDVTLEVAMTIWGPLLDEDHHGRPRAVSWIADHPEATNMALLGMESAASVETALEQASVTGAPPQNIIVAGRDGRIGWSIMGAIPRRTGFDGPLDARIPHSWARGDRGWDGWLAPEEYPRVIRSDSGRLWTANARVVDGAMLRAIGFGGYDLGARAGQIRDGLMRLDTVTERDMLSLQLDDRAVFLDRWRDLVLEILGDGTAVNGDPRHRAFRRHVEDWGGHASVDSVGYRLIRAYRYVVERRLFTMLTAACKTADPRFEYFWIPQRERPLWALVSRRPAHLLEPGFESWEELLRQGVDDALAEFPGDDASLDSLTWGDRNRTRIKHPLSYGVPFLGRWLDMPEIRLPGDSNMPRVQHPSAGASERMVVSPGREGDGFFHMPGGQSGHPLSPHYADGHAAWAAGDPTPLLPGPAVHELTLTPER